MILSDFEIVKLRGFIDNLVQVEALEDIIVLSTDRYSEEGATKYFNEYKHLYNESNLLAERYKNNKPYLYIPKGTCFALRIIFPDLNKLYAVKNGIEVPINPSWSKDIINVKLDIPLNNIGKEYEILYNAYKDYNNCTFMEFLNKLTELGKQVDHLGILS